MLVPSEIMDLTNILEKMKQSGVLINSEFDFMLVKAGVTLNEDGSYTDQSGSVYKRL